MFPFHLFILLQVLLSPFLTGAAASGVEEILGVLEDIQLEESFDTTVGKPLLLGEDMLQERFGEGRP